MAEFLQATGISIGDGAGDHIALSIKEAVLRNLSQSLATFLQARAPQSGSVIGNGSINYRIPLFGTTKAYAQSQTVNVNPNVANIGVKVGDYRTSFYELESFDVSMVGAEGSAAIAEIAANLSQQIMADQNAHFFAALKDYFDDHGEQTIYAPTLVSKKVLSEDQGRLLQKEVANAVNGMTKIINNKYIGVKASEFFGLIDRFAATNLSLVLTRLNASTSAFDLMVKGIDGDTLATFEFGGVRFLIDNFLNNAVAQGASFNGDYAIDNTEKVGYIISREFLAFPLGISTIQNVINPNNGNLRYIAKYCFGSGVLRPELGVAFSTVAEVEEDAVEIAKGASKTLWTNLGTAETFTVSSTNSDVTATLVDNKLTISVDASASAGSTVTIADANSNTLITVTVTLPA